MHKSLRVHFTTLIAFLFCLNLQSNPESIVQIISQPGDLRFIANQLRGQVGRSLITQQKAEAIVTAFRKKEPWQVLLPQSIKQDPRFFSEQSLEQPSIADTSPISSSSPALVIKKKEAPESGRPAVPPKPKREPTPSQVDPVHPPFTPTPQQEKKAYALFKRNSTFFQNKYQEKAKTEYQEALSAPKTIQSHAKPTQIDYSEAWHQKYDATPNPPRLNRENLRIWLQKEKLVNKFLFEPKCLAFKESKGGASTDQLFLVFYQPICLQDYHQARSIPEDISSYGQKKLMFIIKELSQENAAKEITNLDILQKSPLIHSLGRLKDASLPQLTFNEGFYNYTDYAGQSRALSLILPARGDSLFSLIMKNPAQAAKGFEKLGEVLANFHKKFMVDPKCLEGPGNFKSCRTIIHGDLHSENIFYDGKFIYFIDLETMRKSLEKRRSFTKDIIYFAAIHYGWDAENPGSNLTKMFKPYYKMFIKKYLETLTPDPIVQQEIKEMLSTQIKEKGREYVKSIAT